jgi:hypothetical protein
MIELERATVLNAALQRRHGASQHTSAEPEPPVVGDDLQVHVGTGAERPRSFDQRSTGTQVDERYRVPRPKNGLGPSNRRLSKAPIDATID